MRWNSLLKFGGFKRSKTGKYLDPTSKRLVSKETAFNRAAQKLGYKNYANAKQAFASAAYKRIVSSGYKTRKPNGELLKIAVQVKSFAAQVGISENDEKLQRLFAATWNQGESKRNKPLAQLLKYVQKINKYRSVYAGAL